MRITFDIDAKDLKEIQNITGQKKKSPAISRALTDYLRMRERRALIERALAGQTDYALSNKELEARDSPSTSSLGKRNRDRTLSVPRMSGWLARQSSAR